MIDVTEAKDLLRRFSDYKVRQVYGAITIYDTDNEDLVIIHKDKKAYTQYNSGLLRKIPQPNQHKLKDVIEFIQQKVREDYE